MKYSLFCNLEKKIENKILQYLSDFSDRENKILVAYSGGLDSSVLLNIINTISVRKNIQYDFVYINHNMNPNNNHIQEFGKKFAKINKSNFIYHEIDNVPEKNKESFFRNYRYNYLNILRKKNNYSIILTAHHYNDQIETLYMRSRGNYQWTSLLGIRESKEYIRRPLLEIKKSTILNYAIKNGVFWIFDNTNNNNTMFRNNVRNLILPNKNKLSIFFLLLLNKHSKIQFYLFKKRLNLLKEKILIKDSDVMILNKKLFLKLNSNYKKIFLQTIIKKYNNNDYLINKNSKWNALWDYLGKNKNLKDFVLSNNIFINNSKKLIIIKSKKEYRRKINLINDSIWDAHVFKINKKSETENLNKLNQKDVFYIDEKILLEGLFIRNWNIGDFYIDNNKKKKKISKLFLKNKFNNYQKMTYPLVVNSNDQVVWIPGLINGSRFLSFSTNNNCIKISKESLN